MEDAVSIIAQCVKPSIPLRLLLELTGLLLDTEKEDLPSYSVPPGSRYGPVVFQLVDDLKKTLTQLKTMNITDMNNAVEDEMWKIVESPYFAAEIELQGAEILVKQLQSIAQAHFVTLHHLQLDGRRLRHNTNFMVAIDDSRNAYQAFHTACDLIRFGQMTVLYASGRKGIKCPSALLIKDYQMQCSSRELLKCKVLHLENFLPVPTVSQSILKKAVELNVHVLVVGLIGHGGPHVCPMGTTATELLAQTVSTPILLVPNSIVMQSLPGALIPSRVFLLAAQLSEKTLRCLNTTLDMMHTTDTLHILYLSPPEWSPEADATFRQLFDTQLACSQITYTVTLQPSSPHATIGEQLQSASELYKADYLIVGKSTKTGDGNNIQNNSVLSTLFNSPRCSILVCP